MDGWVFFRFFITQSIKWHVWGVTEPGICVCCGANNRMNSMEQVDHRSRATSVQCFGPGDAETPRGNKRSDAWDADKQIKFRIQILDDRLMAMAKVKCELSSAQLKCQSSYHPSRLACCAIIFSFTIVCAVAKRSQSDTFQSAHKIRVDRAKWNECYPRELIQLLGMCHWHCLDALAYEHESKEFY